MLAEAIFSPANTHKKDKAAIRRSETFIGTLSSGISGIFCFGECPGKTHCLEHFDSENLNGLFAAFGGADFLNVCTPHVTW